MVCVVAGDEFLEVGQGWCRASTCSDCASSGYSESKSCGTLQECKDTCTGSCKGVAYVASPVDDEDGCQGEGKGHCITYFDGVARVPWLIQGYYSGV